MGRADADPRGRRRGPQPDAGAASRLHARGRFTRVVLDESGVAAYLAVRTLASGRERVLVRTTDDPLVGKYGQGPDIDRKTLGLAGSVVLWRRGDDLRVRQLSEDTIPAPGPGPLLRERGLRIDADDGTLSVRLHRGPRVEVEDVAGACESPSGCGGVDLLRRAGPFVGIQRFALNAGWGLDVVALRSGKTREVEGNDGAGPFVLLEVGHAAWVASEMLDPSVYPPPRVTRIRTDTGAILDEGAGIDRTSLRRRGDQLVWRHDGVERTAPLP